jgi:hypothetical protein
MKEKTPVVVGRRISGCNCMVSLIMIEDMILSIGNHSEAV